MQNFLHNFLLCKSPLKDEHSFLRATVVEGALSIFSLFFPFFALFNLLILERNQVAFLNTIAFFLSIFLLFYFKRTNKLAQVAKFSTCLLIIFLLLFVYYSQSDHFALVWTIFLPLYAMFANGKREGLRASLLFYSILFIITYQGIGIWENGNWIFTDWIRLVLASLLMLYTVYLIESTYETYEKKLSLASKKEQKLIEKLSKLSVTDPLTELYNRRYYDDIIETMIAVSKRNRQCINFFILDIDFFKSYNDYYGHKKGDEVLHLIAQLVKKNIQRSNDFVFRLGGEEFAGILISDEKEKAQQWIAQLCTKIEALKLEHKQSLCSPYVTVSIGISSKCADEEFSAKELYLEADKALYEAKLKGRNQTQIAN